MREKRTTLKDDQKKNRKRKEKSKVEGRLKKRN